MNSQTLWDKLAENNLVDGAKPADQEHTPWYIRVMQGFAGWVAALFLLGFFGTVLFGFLFRDTNAELLLTLGILCSIGAYIIIRLQKSDFFDQIGMAFSLCGQLMVAIGLFILKFDISTTMFILGGYQLFLAKVIPQYMHRLLTTVFGMLALLIAINSVGLYGLGSAFLAVVFSFIWIKESSWNKSKDLWEPIGYGIAITIVFSSGFLLTGKRIIQETLRGGSGWLFDYSHLINSLIIALIFLNLVIVLLKENKVSFNSKTAILSFVAAAGLILISFKISGISTGLLIVIIGFARQRTTLIVLGTLSVVSFFSWYYYNLHATLLVKSVLLIILGILMFAAWVALRYTYAIGSNDKLANIKPQSFSKNKYLAIVTIAIALVAINININKKQDLIKNGEILLIKLTPVDPRSIMQGDYMRLRFEIDNKIASAVKEKNTHNTFSSFYDGYAIIEKDKDNIVSFVTLFENQTLEQNQRLMPYKYRNGLVRFTTNAFFFQEGQASHFQQSEYGEFRMSADGDILLVHMVDKDLNVL